MTASETPTTDTTTTDPNEGDLTIWYYPQVGRLKAPYEVTVPDLRTAVFTLDAVIGLSIFEFKNRIKPDYTDAAGIARYESDGEGGFGWFEIDEDELAELGLEAPPMYLSPPGWEQVNGR